MENIGGMIIALIGVYFITWMIWASFDDSSDKLLTKKENYRIVQSGDKFAIEKRFLPGILFNYKWTKADFDYDFIFDSVEEAEERIEHKILIWESILENRLDKKDKKVVKTYKQ